jgi:2OG-Fe(II) oxygenase superfamily
MDWNRFHPNVNHTDDEVLVRTDKVYFQKNQERLRHVNGMQAVQGKLRSVGSALVLSNFSGFKLVSNSFTPGHQTYDRDRLYAPTEMQVSFYDDGGSYYNVHTDGCHDSLQEMGLLGYLRSWYLQKRYLTSIVYLTDTEREWNVNDGGCLRVFHHQSEADDAPAPRVDAETVASSFTDIQPKSGRLVLFSSMNTAHAVLPTFAPRLACCVWFTMH